MNCVDRPLSDSHTNVTSRSERALDRSADWVRDSLCVAPLKSIPKILQSVFFCFRLDRQYTLTNGQWSHFLECHSVLEPYSMSTRTKCENFTFLSVENSNKIRTWCLLAVCLLADGHTNVSWFSKTSISRTTRASDSVLCWATSAYDGVQLKNWFKTFAFDWLTDVCIEFYLVSPVITGIKCFKKFVKYLTLEFTLHFPAAISGTNLCVKYEKILVNFGLLAR